ncbi:hypothetical protein [uncultured Maricaulis sp.]|uniref:hypothetical protein n=1 Tax=uncultured Maricaulis sp. TaxID=174710 RepID=UPI0030D879C4
MAREIDTAAREQVLHTFGIPECLHVPVAAVDEAAIHTHIGEIVQHLGRRTPPGAFLVHVDEPPPRSESLPIWEKEGSAVFHRREQVWAHVSYTRYREAYRRAFPDENIAQLILSHCMNRRVAAIKGFQYVRITPTSRRANSSSAFSEKWGVALYSKPSELAAFKRRGLAIQYADLSDLMLMLDLNLGGGIMDAVNAGQKLILPPEQGALKWPRN